MKKLTVILKGPQKFNKDMSEFPYTFIRVDESSDVSELVRESDGPTLAAITYATLGERTFDLTITSDKEVIEYAKTLTHLPIEKREFRLVVKQFYMDIHNEYSEDTIVDEKYVIRKTIDNAKVIDEMLASVYFPRRPLEHGMWRYYYLDSMDEVDEFYKDYTRYEELMELSKDELIKQLIYSERENVDLMERNDMLEESYWDDRDDYDF